MEREERKKNRDMNQTKNKQINYARDATESKSFLQQFKLCCLVFSADYSIHLGQLEFESQEKRDNFRSENL